VRWHLVTGEYPPQPGGVSDYTRQIAHGLAAAGDRVDVWAPDVNRGDTRGNEADEAESRDFGTTVHRLPDRFGPKSLLHLTREFSRFPSPQRLLVQYVPHAFGWKGANLLFCVWLRLRRRDSIWVMFHEVMYRAEGDRRASHLALAAANRWMAALVAGAAERGFVSIPGWRPLVEPLLRKGTSLTWLPVPSAIPVSEDAAASAAIHARCAGGRQLVGHFGTYGSAVGAILEPTLEHLAVMSDCSVLLLGDRSEEACRALTAAHPALVGRLFATGRLSERDISHHVAACDVMLQPYPDGISGRRTSAMVALSHGRPIVTTAGRLTEPVWAETDAAVLVPAGDPHALAAAAAAMLFDVSRREGIGRRASALYDARFHVRHSISVLRASNAASPS
jgi:hypothetical protein